MCISDQENSEVIGPQAKVSLLDQHNELKKKAEGTKGCFTGDTPLISLVSSQGIGKRQTA